ncbi:MAG: HAMP domain-containing sensor histidine kinase, partial [Pseudomonadota bacterium]|nr:HAMP domain-containing sensor histidine kinase [Pseudomonadota bacterium]
LSRKSRVIQIRCNNGMVLEAANIPSPDGTVLLRYADITDSVKLEDTLRDRAREVAEYAELITSANRLKSEFLANLSHEIKAPLNDINGLAELLSGNYFGMLNQRQQEYADGICKETGDLSDLVSDIMNLSAIEAGLLECNLESVDLHAILADILRLVGERTRQKKIMLRFECSIDIGFINVDQKKFKQCMLHLLGNAITYSSSGGELSITVNRNKEGVTIDIRDTGTGIPKADLERVFIGFETGNFDDSIKKGTGLGLTLVRALIELQGGTINIRSKPNQGTIVSLFLPENSVN